MKASRQVRMVIWYMLLVLLFVSRIPFASCAQSSDSAPCDEYRESVPRDKILYILSEQNKADALYDGKTMFYYAAILGLHDRLRVWAADKQRIAAIDKNTMVDVATVGDLESLKILVLSGASPDLASDGGATALISAAGCGRLKIMAYLIHVGANMYSRNEDGIDAMIHSIMVGNSDGVRLLLDNGFDLRLSKTRNGLSVFDVARRKGNAAIIEMLGKQPAK